MVKNYFKTYSHYLGHDMEFVSYGNQGRVLIAFPSQDGRFSDYEGFGMIDVLRPWIEAGKLTVVCPDGMDWLTWSNRNGDYHWRIEQHERWFKYITNELPVFIRELVVLNPDDARTFMTTGCSMGGFHAANFFFRFPQIFDTLIALSGLYNADYFFPNYNDELIYLNSPMDFLPNLPEGHPDLKLLRKRDIIICVGQGAWEDELAESTRRLDTILAQKKIPAWFDYWGYDVAHDWYWWRIQLAYFMEKVIPLHPENEEGQQ